MKCGDAQKTLAIIENGTLVVGVDGCIAGVGTAEDMESRFANDTFDSDLDGRGMSVIPGLVDGHTHPVWSGNRVQEFSMKLAGATYMEVHAAGGGIFSTVRATRASSEEELVELFIKRLDRMMKGGTTTVEAKSGYGLDLATERKMLRVLNQGENAHPLDVSATYCGAHAVPKEMSAADATTDVISVQLPALLAERASGELRFDSLDVFCDKGVFERENSARILRAGADAGLLLNFHGDEIFPLQTGVLAAEVGAAAVSHCERMTGEDIAAMASASTPVVGVILPTTAYILRLDPPPARDMIDGGVPVALGSDFNPNAHCLSMPLVMHLACVLMRMTLAEALVAATINSAASLRRSDRIGSLEEGKAGDLVVVGAPSWESLVYELGDPPVRYVVKSGSIVHQAAPH